MEEGLRAFGFGRLDILRPGLLMGAREGPARLGEGIAMMAAPLTDALLHASLRRYRSIPAAIVARAMLALAARREPGTYVHANDTTRAPPHFPRHTAPPHTRPPADPPPN